jgi:predicted lipoprotein with Yx(FWY)xxD motif
MFICIVLDRASFQLLLADVQEDINGEMNAREAKDARRRFSEEGMYLYVYLMDIYV